MTFIYLLLSFVLTTVSQNIDPSEYNDHFNCIDDVETGWTCCGYNALGERHCEAEDRWEAFEGKYRRCVTEFGPGAQQYHGTRYDHPSDLVGQNVDMCCDAHYVDNTGQRWPNYAPNCGVCKQFFVWPWNDVDGMVAASTTEQTWRDDFVNQVRSDRDGYDNQIYPGGFQQATLREFNDPNVCVYIPEAGGKLIEIKVESDEYGDRLCIGDVHDEETERNDPGQNDACGPTQVKTCFGDAYKTDDTPEEAKRDGFSFYIFCDQACKEGGGSGDVPLWVRARNSVRSWDVDPEDQADSATNNPEMWCEYVIRDYPEWDVYPSDLSIAVDAVVQPDQDSSMSVKTVLLFGFLLLLL